ncbi:unnamed protein product [Cylicocyclus nassatus]|uniref:Uncharacterized protein n=1 Tax=Cylicocyclus nassatus TaxID=53992 RepID=A0AA36GNE7_CYLNA|nr:unnamed protein product [Cylicocyclus nassatus]
MKTNSRSSPNVDVTKIGAAAHHKQLSPRESCGNHVLNTAENVREDQEDIASKFSTKDVAVDTNASALEEDMLNQKIPLISLPVDLDYDLEITVSIIGVGVHLKRRLLLVFYGNLVLSTAKNAKEEKAEVVCKCTIRNAVEDINASAKEDHIRNPRIK